MSRIIAFLADAARFHRTQGALALLRFVKSRLYETTENLLYELPWTGTRPELPAGWEMTVVRSQGDAVGMDLLLRTGGEPELRNFWHKAEAYVLSIDGEPAARCWHFPHTPMARHLGPHATYVGNMYVRPEWRGLGIQGKLNAYVSSCLPEGTRMLMEVVTANVASHRGLIRGGAVLLGRLRMTVVCGQILRTRITPVPVAEVLGREA